MAITSRFKIVQLLSHNIELWEGTTYLGSFFSMEDILEFVFALRRYAPEESTQLRLDWT